MINKEAMTGWLMDYIKFHKNTRCYCNIEQKYSDYKALTDRYNELFPELEGCTVLGHNLKEIIEEYGCGCDFKDTNVRVRTLGVVFEDIETFLLIIDALVKKPTEGETDNGTV